MKKTQILLLFSLIILIMTTSVVSANNDATLLEDSTTTESITEENNIGLLERCENTKDKLTAGNDVYVNASSSSTEDGTQKNPYKTITNDIVNNLSDNTNVYISNGNYAISTINLSKSMTIIGQSTTNTILNSNTTENMFLINPNVQLTLINLTIQNHNSTTQAAINNRGILTVKNCILNNNSRDNRSTGWGAAIANHATLNVENSNFTNNFASWGSGVYNNNSAVMNVKNSEFYDNHIMNVGGAIYSNRAIVNVDNCTFTRNAAVSGAAIYNAFGTLFVNNSLFYKNEAESFYGGAIYSTGIASSYNTIFLSNKATYDGGAITNTNNFTFVNCTFEQNSANQNGGAIENIAWTITENGNLTLINCSFSENYAGSDGGAIMNYNSTPVAYNYGTVTADSTVFYGNTAGNRGGAISNNQYVNVENCVFVENEAEESNAIYSLADVVKSVDNNWWGNSSPNWNKTGVTPNTWRVMTFTNTTSLIEGLECKFTISLNKLNDGKTIDANLPSRTAYVFVNNSIFDSKVLNVDNEVNINAIPAYENISAQIDKEMITLTPKLTNISYSFKHNNNTMIIKVNLSENVSGKASLKINGKTIVSKIKFSNGSLTYEYTIPAKLGKDEYMLSVVMRTNDNQVLNKNMTIKLEKRDVKTTLIVRSLNKTLKAGCTVSLTANVDIYGDLVNSGKVAFKINGKTIQTNIKVVNGTASINYTIPSDFTPKDYNFSVVYSGDSNKNSKIASKIVTLSKLNVHVNPNETFTFMSGSGISVIMSLYDEFDNYVLEGKVCYKINHVTVETNITLDEGIFFFEYVTPEVDEGKTLKQTLTVKMGENKRYNEFNIDIPIIIN